MGAGGGGWGRGGGDGGGGGGFPRETIPRNSTLRNRSQ